jgi:predicted phosphodiesterase
MNYDESQLVEAYKRAGNNKARAAEFLGIPRSTFRRHLDAALTDTNLAESVMERILIVPDTHAPYQDRRAWDLMMSAASDLEPDVIVHMGDLLDCYCISQYSRDPARESMLDVEVEEGKELLRQLDYLQPNRKVLVAGNHEDRLRRYLQDRAPELSNLVSIPKLLELDETGWEYIPYRESVQIGKVYFTHDAGYTGQYATYRALETFSHSVAVGHSHSMQYLVTGDATGKYRVGAQFGWLGDVNKVDYMHKVRAQRLWSLGFGTGYWDKSTGTVFLVPVPIVNYTCVVNGRLYKNG